MVTSTATVHQVKFFCLPPSSFFHSFLSSLAGLGPPELTFIQPPSSFQPPWRLLLSIQASSSFVLSSRRCSEVENTVSCTPPIHFDSAARDPFPFFPHNFATARSPSFSPRAKQIRLTRSNRSTFDPIRLGPTPNTPSTHHIPF